MTGTPSTSALTLSRANNLNDVANAPAAVANISAVPATQPALAFYEPLFQSTGIFSNTSGGSFAIAGGGGLVANVNGTNAFGRIVLPKANDATKPWRVNVDMVYNGDATNPTVVYFENPNDTTWGVFYFGFNGGALYVGLGGSQQISSDALTNGNTYRFSAASDGNRIIVGCIPLARGGTENAAGFSSHQACETFVIEPISFTNGAHTPPYQKTQHIRVQNGSSTNVVKGILFNQGGLGGGTDSRFQPPAICPFQITRPDGVVDNTGVIFIPESYDGKSQFDVAFVMHPNNSGEDIGFRRVDPDAGAAFASLRANGIAMAWQRGDPSGYSNSYASPWGAAIGVSLLKQGMDQILNLLPGPGGAPSVRNLHLIGQSMGGLNACNVAAGYPQLPVRSISGISAATTLAALYAGSGGGVNNSTIINSSFATYYVSLQAANTGNAVSSGTWWQQVTPPGGVLPKPYATYTNRGVYGSGTTYALNDVVSVNATAATQSAFADPNFRTSAFNSISLAFWHGDSDTTVPISQLNTFVASMTSEGNTPTKNTISGAGHLNAAGLWVAAGLLANMAAGNALAVRTPVAIAISGVTGSGAAAAGVVGEEISSTIAVGSAVSLTTDTAANVTSISLAAGDWLIDGQVDYHAGATTTSTYFQQGASSASATLGAQDTYSSDPLAIVTGGTIDFGSPIPVQRLHLAAMMTVYLVAKAGFAVSTLTAYGKLHATRIR